MRGEEIESIARSERLDRNVIYLWLRQLGAFGTPRIGPRIRLVTDKKARAAFDAQKARATPRLAA